MLLPNDRSILLEDLRPPPGFALSGAIATTFTLDLTTAVIPTLAFSSIALSTTTPDPVSALEAVRLAAEKVDVFCQAGNIGIPARASALLAFVEPMVHAVRRPRGGLFHPKVWFAKYVDDEGGAAYRLLVLTRNLTNDRAWDIAVRLDSQGVSTRPLPVNYPLRRFLSDLPAQAVSALPAARRRRIMSLAEEARHVIWSLPEGAEEFCFHYLPDDGLDTTGARHLIVAPFMNEAGIQQLLADTPGACVISRAEALDQLTAERLDGLQTFVLSEIPEADDEESLGTNTLHGLHAKMFVIEPHGRARKARVLIGSANATDAALMKNVEFMVEFVGPRRLFGVDTFIGPEGSVYPLIEEYTSRGGEPPDPEVEERWQLENCLRSIAEIPHTVEVADSSNGSGPFSLHVQADKAYSLRPDWSVSVELLTRPGIARDVESGRPLDASFDGVAKADITPFVCIRVASKTGLSAGTVLLAKLVNDPSDRLDVVLASQIDTPEKFLRFVHLLLSLGSPHLMADAAEGSGTGDSWLVGPGSPGVLELALRALVHRPQAIDDLDRLVQRLETTEAGVSLLPDGFTEVWSQVRVARKRGRR